MKVRYLLMLTEDVWGPVFYRCGHCSSGVSSSDLESHADNVHGVKEIEVMNDGSKV